jgi:hypothetical protein
MPRCNKPLRTTHAAAWLTAAALAATACAAGTDSVADTREVFNQGAPPWLGAVGKLLVPGSIYRDGFRIHLQENCSATLVARSPASKADTIITAWHCLVNYRDLSKPIIFTLPAGPGGALEREAYRLADGGGMHADWALLRLRLPVAPGEAASLAIHPGRADPGQRISMAGYSRDPGKGQGGNLLTFDPGCHITAQGPVITESDCLAHKGASGGAVVQMSAGGSAQFSGVVSEGDGAGFSTFVPVTAFRSAINRYLY